MTSYTIVFLSHFAWADQMHRYSL